ncbi:AAA family ATPase [Streptomyces ferrugineus]|uniref:AAA family ATPase n=1 Tax=Streptomyces ferrugineus TaxID=1413221 RepID=A0A7M2T0F7_9ACTN|nr:AAA family ATPase [Streptomyces ferrugineus]
MSRDLFVKQVVINSTGGVRTLDFAHPVVCVYGPIDTGKTTLVDCIKYPLGLPVDWRQVPSERLTSVTVHLRIEGMDIALRRSTIADTGTVELISPYDGKAEELLDVTPQPDSDRRVVGEALLDLLGLSELFAPPTAVALLGNGARLTFAQLYALNYLSQDMVDGTESVRGQANTAQSYKTIVELVLGLIDAEMRVLTARRDDLGQTVSQFKRRTETISEFLTGSAAELEEELTRSRSEERDTLTALEELKGRMRAVTTFADPLRQRVAALEGTHSRAREEEKAAQAALSLAQRAIQRAQQPGTDPVLHCPSCRQALTGRVVPEGACALCLSELDPGVRDAVVQAAEAALATAQQRAIEAAKTAGEAQDALAQARAELEERTRLEIGPLAGQIEQLSAAHAGARTRTGMLERQLDPHRRLLELQRALRTAEEELRGVREDIKTRKNLLSGRQTTLAEIEEQFSAIIDGLSLPNEPGARIDHNSLLPKVRAGKLTKVGHGVRTAINVAYRMTFLSHALVTGATDLPSLLIIDSPRKNVGYGDEDQQLIARLYAHFLDHIAGARSHTPHARPHQVIIVDNDLPSLPPHLRRQMHTIELTRDNPLVP